MGKRAIVGAAVSLLASLVLLWTWAFFSGLSVRAQQTFSAQSEQANALWVASNGGILKLATADGSLLFEMPDAGDVHAIAIDEQRATVWAYGQGILQAYGFDGAPLRSVPILQPDADDAHLALAVNPRDGTVWLGLHQTLFHFDAQDQVLKTIPLTDNVQALALDIALARLWVATKKAVSAYADAGLVVPVLALGKSPEVRAIDVDAGSGELWLALQKTLQRYNPDGALLFQISLDKLAHVASDGQGNVWVATDKDLIRVDQFGQAKFMPRPFSGTDTIVALTSDPADSSAWVASHNALSHIDAEGVIIHQLTFNGSDPDLHFEGSIRAVAVYADTIPPTLSVAAPVGCSLINTNPPDIAVEYRDVGVGVNTATLHIQANADALAVDCTFGETGATCRPAAKLPEGPVTLIADHAGNLSEPAEISFTMDTIPPIITRMSRMRAPRPIRPSRSSAGI